MNDHMVLLVFIIALVAQLGIPIPTFPIFVFVGGSNAHGSAEIHSVGIAIASLGTPVRWNGFPVSPFRYIRSARTIESQKNGSARR
jgi:hypothetical protein